MIECVAFSAGHFDSHAAFDKESKVYIVKYSGDYVVFDSKGWRKVTLKEGDKLTQVSYVVGETCGVFYNYALKEIKKAEK